MPSPAGHLIQVDSITIFSEGIKNYLVNAIDVVSKFGFTYKYDNLNSYNAKDFIEKVRKVLYWVYLTGEEKSSRMFNYEIEYS